MMIRDAYIEDAHYLKTRLRQADAAEVRAATGRRPEAIVPLSFELSVRKYVLQSDTDERPIAMYGVAPDPKVPDAGIVWMLCTPRIKEVSKSLLRAAPDLVRELQQHYPTLHNIVHARNLTSVRWVQSAGFEIGGGIMLHSEPFFYFKTSVGQ